MKLPLWRIACFVFLMGCSPSPPAPVAPKVDYAPAIKAVLAERLVARSNAWVQNWPEALNRPKEWDPTRYAKSIRAIDTGACPLPFRAAWLEYVHALENYSRFKPELTPGEVLGVASGVVGATAAAAQIVAGGKNPVKVEPAWQKVESVALEFGVDYSRD